MGQVPKNNIIKALEGATLTLRVNGVLKKVPVEKADEAMSKEADRLIEAGELRPSEKVAYMNSWNKVKDMSMTGEFSIDTAGKDFVSAINYHGAPTSFGMVDGKPSERGRFSSAFTKKPRRDNMTDIEGVVNRTAFAQLGRLSLEGDEAEEAAKAKTRADIAAKEQSAKKTQQATAASDEWANAPLQSWYGKQWGGEGDFMQSLIGLNAQDKEAMMQRHFNEVIPNWLKYKSLEGLGLEWADKYKNPEGGYNFSQDLYKDFLQRGWSDAGLDFYNLMQGIDPDTRTTLSEEEIEKQKAAKTTKELAERDWNMDASSPNAKVINDNMLESKTALSKIMLNNPSRRFRPGRMRDPKTGDINDILIEYHSADKTAENTPLRLPIYKRIKDPRDGKIIYVNIENNKEILSPEEFKDADDDATELLNSTRFYGNYKDGGVIKAQDGSILDPNMFKKRDRSFKQSKSVDKTETDSTTNRSERKTTGTNTETESNPVKAEDHSAKIKDIHFTTADILDATSLIGDIVGLGASFVPGGSLVAGGAGLSGTFAAMGAERSRGELGTEDIGKYALSLGLDAASFLPGVGLGAKVAKLSKVAPVLVNLLTKAAEFGMAGYGVYAGVDGIVNVRDKIAAGGWDSITTQDLKTITQALTAIVNAKHISASKKSFEVSEKQGTAMGRAMNKTTGEIIDVPITKVEGKWVSQNPSITDASHVLLKEGPMLGKKFIQGTREITPSAEIPTRLRAGKEFEYNPTTGVKYNIFQRLDLPKPSGQLRNIYSAKARASVPEAPLLGPGNIDVSSLKQKRLEFLKSKKRPASERAAELAPYLESRKAMNTAPEMPLMRGPEGKMLDKKTSKVVRQNEIARTFRADAQKIKDIETGIKTGYPLVRDPATNKFMSVEKSKQYYSDLKNKKPMMTVVRNTAPKTKPLTVIKGGSSKPTGAPFTTQKGGGKKGTAKGKLTVKREQGGIIKGQGGLPSGWYDALESKRIPMVGSEFPAISGNSSVQAPIVTSSGTPSPSLYKAAPALQPLPPNSFMGDRYKTFTDQKLGTPQSTLGTPTIMGSKYAPDVYRSFQPTVSFGEQSPKSSAYKLQAPVATHVGLWKNGEMPSFLTKKLFSKPVAFKDMLFTRQKWDYLGKSGLGEFTRIEQPSAKNPTFLDRLNNLQNNPKAGLAASEALRTLFLNNALDKQKESKLYTPEISDVAETRMGVHGDLLTKNMYDEQASRVRSSATAYNLSSDPRMNAAMMAQANQAAMDLESRGALGFAQGLDRSRQMDLQNTAANNMSRKQNADLRSQYLQKALMYRDQTNKSLDAQKASNLNTLWASTNLDKKRSIYEKEQDLKNLAFEQKVAEIEAKYPNAMSYWLPTGPKTPEAKKAAEEYSKEILEAKRNILYEKSGGSLPNTYKHELMLYKENSKFKKDISTAINKWTEKQGNRAFASSAAVSKELNNLVAKLFSK